MSYKDDFDAMFNKMVNNIADTLENIKDNDFMYEEDGQSRNYFEDIYNLDYIWRMGYGLVGVRVMVTCGGPNIWVDTMEKAVHGYWGGDEAVAYLTTSCCDAIDDFFGQDAADVIYYDAQN